MEKTNIATGKSPELHLKQVMGDLQVKGWDRQEIEYFADPEEVSIEEKEGSFSIRCTSDLAIRVPADSFLKVGQAHGDARFKELKQPLSIEQVYGSLTLRSVGEANIDQVYGDLIARQVNGDLSANRINGNFHGRDIQNACVLNDVNGNLEIQYIEGPVQAEVNGNARLKLPRLSEGGYKVKADGNIQVELPLETNATLHLISKGSLIRVRLPGNSQTYHQSNLELTLGDGSSHIHLTAYGNISVSNLEPRWESTDERGEDYDPYSYLPPDFGERIAQQVESQIESQMEFMTRQMSEQLERMGAAFDRSGMSQQEADRIVEEVRLKSEKAAARAQEKMRRSQEKMEKKMEAQRRRAEAESKAAERRAQSSSRRGWSFTWPPTNAQPATVNKPQASEEERLMILKMLEQKKITLDEAANLLEALEGKGG
jgi:DUF4097 and DUF4098 domain-containing protein YvlB